MIALDDNIEDHPKFVSLSDEAFGLWVRCIGYCRRNLTDGYVPEASAKSRCRGSRSPAKIIGELLAPPVGAPEMTPLWSRVLGGYQVHDYLDWNPSKVDVEIQREAKRAAGRSGGRRSGEARREATAKQDRSKTEAECFASGSAVANPDPIRSGSDPQKKRSLPETPPPPPLTGRARTDAAAAPEVDFAATTANPAVAQVLRALQASSKLKHLVKPAFAERVAVHSCEHGFTGSHPLADIERSIAEADAKVADVEAAGELVGNVPSLVLGFVRKGPRRELTRAAPVRAPSPRDVRPDVDPDYETREAQANAEFMAEKRAKTEADRAAGKDVSW